MKDKTKALLQRVIKHPFLKHPFFLVVLLPVIIVAFYYFFIVSPRYESYAIVSLKNNSTTQMPDSTLAMLSGMDSKSSQNDYFLINYITSFRMLKQLNKQTDLKSLYSKENIDFLSRLPEQATKKTFLEYFQSMVLPEYDKESGLITIRAQAYSAKNSQKILKNIINNSQEAVDYVSHTLAKKNMKFNKKFMVQSRQKALNAQKAVLTFQNKHGIVDPKESVAAISGIIKNMKAQKAKAESELTAMRSYLNETAPEIKSKKQTIAALKKQIKEERQALVKDEQSKQMKNNGEELNELTSHYQWLKLKAEFAMTEYKLAMKSYEKAKLDSIKQQSILVTVVKPTLPEEPEYPWVWYNLLTLLIILLAVYGIGRMIITIILEHR